MSEHYSVYTQSLNTIKIVRGFVLRKTILCLVSHQIDMVLFLWNNKCIMDKETKVLSLTNRPDKDYPIHQ